MKTSKNCWVTPTDKPSNGYILGKCIKELSDVKIGQFTKTYYLMFSEEYFQPHNIYITSDEEIKTGDYYKSGKFIWQMKYPQWGEEGQGDAKKIILTTDQDLIKDSVQAIDDEFLEWFVKNPSCESVKVIKHMIWDEYKIIIPKEEPKQETLEEAAERYANESFIPMRNLEGEPLRIPVGQSVPCGFTKHKKVAIKHFTNGAKWQQQNSYSEEDFKLFARQFYREIKLDKSNLLWDELADKCFEQFKKK